ncbi:hypothetical protein AMECASPLE_012433 [Ameca splendens]|uniref:Uncharacterized protein n=1 Tax=Ameca splendens TaxID=208324 RepID=A0ABV0Z9Y6_9TELE
MKNPQRVGEICSFFSSLEHFGIQQNELEGAAEWRDVWVFLPKNTFFCKTFIYLCSFSDLILNTSLILVRVNFLHVHTKVILLRNRLGSLSSNNTRLILIIGY